MSDVQGMVAAAASRPNERNAAGRRCLRVAHVSPTFFDDKSIIGGGERYVYYLARSLAAVASMLPVAFNQTIFALGTEENLFIEAGIPVRVLPNENPSPNPMSGISGHLWRELSTFDLVHVHQALTVFGAYCASIVKSLGKSLVLTDLGGGDNSIMTTGRGVELADGVISISRYAHSLVSTKFSGPYEILVGPVDTDLFAPTFDKARDRTSAICVGRILPHKGIDRVIAALPQGLRVRIVGRVYHEPYYKMLKKMSKGKDVVFIHDADDKMLVELYRSSGLFLQASTTKDCYGTIVRKPELMGLTTLEAMSCGLPAIVSNAGSLPELVRDPDFGLVFSSDDELAGCLRAFLRGAWPPHGAAEKARRHVVANHSFAAIGRQLCNFYMSVHDKAGRGR